MSYNFIVLKDDPIGFWDLSETSGTVAYDSSGCQNDSSYVFTSPSYHASRIQKLPIAIGSDHSSLINSDGYIELSLLKDYYGENTKGSIGDKYSSDNDFTLECWFYPNTLSAETPIFADTDSSVGLFWDNGTIFFKAGSVTLQYTLSHYKMAMHIVATYTPQTISLYVNGMPVSKQYVNQNVFTNDELNLSIGPVASGDSFIIDSPAVYRYALDHPKIINHYLASESISPYQIVNPDKGVLFNLNDANLFVAHKYEIPRQKSLSNYADSSIYYDINNDYIALISTLDPTPQTFVIEDFIRIPTGIDIVSSKIEWIGDNGISVQTKIDGGEYEDCINGYPIPQVRIGDNVNDSSVLYFKITIDSSDCSKYVPILRSIGFYFYTDKTIYAQNSGDYISVLPSSSDSWDYALSSRSYSQTRRCLDGLTTFDDNGFKLNTAKNIKTIEMFYSPTDAGAGSIVSQSGSLNFSWNISGSISKTNIANVYINGEDKTSMTNIWDGLSLNVPNHIVFVLSSAVTAEILFNENSKQATYQYLAIYEDALSEETSLNHYYLYTNRAYSVPNTLSINVTENDFSVYDLDWDFIQSL